MLNTVCPHHLVEVVFNVVWKMLCNRYKTGKNRWFFQKLRFWTFATVLHMHIQFIALLSQIRCELNSVFRQLYVKTYCAHNGNMIIKGPQEYNLTELHDRKEFNLLTIFCKIVNSCYDIHFGLAVIMKHWHYFVLQVPVITWRDTLLQVRKTAVGHALLMLCKIWW